MLDRSTIGGRLLDAGANNPCALHVFNPENVRRLGGVPIRRYRRQGRAPPMGLVRTVTQKGRGVCGSQLHPGHGKLFSALALATVKRLDGDTAVIDENDNFYTGWRMARVGAIALLEKKPADNHSPKRIDSYIVEGEKKFKLEPQRVLFSLW
jgi:hypothetical protein